MSTVREIALKALSLLVIALMTIPVIGYVGPWTTASAGDPALVAAEAYVNRISTFINRTLEIATIFNITIPDNMTILVNESLSLLAMAEQALAQGDADLAVEYATNASSTFAPVAILVYQSLPDDAREELVRQRLEAAIEAREELTLRIQAMLERMRMHGVPIDNETLERLNEALAKLQVAKRMVENGNYEDARRLMANATMIVGHEVRETMMEIHAYAHRISAVYAALNGFTVALETISTYLNYTVNLIEEGYIDQALMRLAAVENRLEGLGNALDRIADVAEERGVNESYVELIRVMANHTWTAAEYVNYSIQSLEENDTNGSIVYIGLAIETLGEAVEIVSNSSLLQDLREKVIACRHAMERLNETARRIAAGYFAKLSAHIDAEKARLQHLLEQYQNGQAPLQRVQYEFQKTLNKMLMLKSRLQGHAPDWLLEKINEFIQWLQDNMPQGGAGQGGSHQGPHRP